jgi:hypothetical protein
MVVKKSVGRADETGASRLQNIQIGGNWEENESKNHRELERHKNN